MPAGPKTPAVLVTGASGMLGLALCDHLAGRFQVIGVSKSGRYQTRPCDLSQDGQVRALFQDCSFDAVIHAAAYSDVDGCEKDPAAAHAANALAVKYLSQACGQAGVPLIHVSTDYVFYGDRSKPYTETDATFPKNIYGMTKLEGEFFAASSAASSAVVRTSWLFGAGNPKSFVNAIIERLKSQNAVSVLADQTDSPTYVKDLAEAVEGITDHLLREKGKILHEIFHVCNRGATTRYEMTLKIKEWLGLKNVEVSRTETIPDRPAVRPVYAVMSTERYEKYFEKKMRTWQEALKEYVDGAERKNSK